MLSRCGLYQQERNEIPLQPDNKILVLILFFMFICLSLFRKLN
jgi:hypothetical protein